MPQQFTTTDLPPICRCDHFDRIHDPVTKACNADGCPCLVLDVVPFEQSDFGRYVQSVIEKDLQQI